MLSGLLLIKIAVTLILVVGLSVIAEHMSARFAGILAGMPHGLAILLFFIGTEQGVAFAAEAAQAASGSIAANAAHALGFVLLARGTGWAAALRTATGAVTAYALAAALIRALAPGAFAGALISLAALTGLAWAMRRFPDPGRVKRPRATPGELALRAALAAGIVLAITAAAGLVGPRWAGLFSGFPVVTLPVLLILQARHGPELVSGLVKAYPWGLTALIFYTLVVAWTFPRLGIGLGTLAGLALSIVWILALNGIRARLLMHHKSRLK